jgi:hypothetical protein
MPAALVKWKSEMYLKYHVHIFFEIGYFTMPSILKLCSGEVYIVTCLPSQGRGGMMILAGFLLTPTPRGPGIRDEQLK